MPSKNSERRKTANRTKAYHKWVNYYKEIYGCEPSYKESRIFCKAFNMGWKYHKKESKKGFKKIMYYIKSRHLKKRKGE